MQLNDQNYCHAVLHEREANTLIGEYLKKDQPFLVSKAANIACEIASSVILKQQPIAEHLKIQALVNMGVFPNTEKNLQKFAYNYVESITNIDIMGIWAVPDYDWLVNTYCPQAHYTRLWGMEPYHFHNPWSANLENKTVLVIHPFEKSIKNNYCNREKLLDQVSYKSLIMTETKCLLTTERTQTFKNKYQMKKIHKMSHLYSSMIENRTMPVEGYSPESKSKIISSRIEISSPERIINKNSEEIDIPIENEGKLTFEMATTESPDIQMKKIAFNKTKV